jgi:hypothetical protein
MTTADGLSLPPLEMTRAEVSTQPRMRPLGDDEAEQRLIMELAQRSPETAQLMARDIQARRQKPQEDATKSRIREVEQLWKDATRAKTQAQFNQNETEVARQDGFIKQLEAELAAMAPDTWGRWKGDTQPTTAAPAAPKAEPKETPDTIKQDFQFDEQGVMTNFPELAARLAAYHSEFGAGTNSAAYKNDLEFLQNKQATEERRRKAIIEKADRERGISREKRMEDLSMDDRIAAVGPMIYSYREMQGPNPTTAQKSTALVSVLRKESGAAIGEKEYSGRMKGWLGPLYDQYIDEVTSMKIPLSGFISGDVRANQLERIQEKYLAKVPATAIADFIRIALPDGVREEAMRREDARVKAQKSTQPTAPAQPGRLQRVTTTEGF